MTRAIVLLALWGCSNEFVPPRSPTGKLGRFALLVEGQSVREYALLVGSSATVSVDGWVPARIPEVGAPDYPTPQSLKSSDPTVVMALDREPAATTFPVLGVSRGQSQLEIIDDRGDLMEVDDLHVEELDRLVFEETGPIRMVEGAKFTADALGSGRGRRVLLRDVPFQQTAGDGGLFTEAEGEVMLTQTSRDQQLRVYGIMGEGPASVKVGVRGKIAALELVGIRESSLIDLKLLARDHHVDVQAIDSEGLVRGAHCQWSSPTGLHFTQEYVVLAPGKPASDYSFNGPKGHHTATCRVGEKSAIFAADIL